MVKPHSLLIAFSDRVASGKRYAIGLFLLVCALGVGPLSPGRASESQPEASAASTELSGESLVIQACFHCHDLREITAQTKTEEEWRVTVNQMIWRGAQILPHEVDLLASHLAAAYSVERMSADAGGAELPAGSGRGLIEEACLGCHTAEIIVTQRKDASAWSETMDRMMELGSELTDSEAKIVTEYLIAHFGPRQD